MRNFSYKEEGFTLIEVLLSLVILSTVVIGMMTFFSNGLSYVKQNESKTVATQVARSVFDYMEKQDFTSIEGYTNYALENGITIPKLDNTYCDKAVTINVKNFYNVNDRLEIKNTKLFDNEARCTSILSPVINNIPFNSKISIYLFPYESQMLEELKNRIAINDSSLNNIPESLLRHINSKTSLQTNSYVNDHLLLAFVVLDWKENRDDIIIQGVISHESIR